MKKYLLILVSLFFTHGIILGQECIGGSIHTNEAFLYGRFEVSMRSVEGDGIISSFFLYNLDVGCNWPEENNELDIEMKGNSEEILFTTHYPGPWFHTDTYFPSFNPHDDLHDYAFEWEPGIVRWFVDGELVNVQDQPFVEDLVYPMRIIMNLWAAELESWVGPWDPAIMPVESEYDYVRYYDYTPGTGNTGTDNNFTFAWEDNFDTFDSGRWKVEEFGGFSGNYCTFKPSSVEFENGRLYLQLEPEPAIVETVPVTFSVDLSGQDLQPTDVIHLNGTFNNWCGNCAPMEESGSIWSLTVELEPGRYEYLFTKNFWEENGGAPLGSECDFSPCDQYVNYGFVIQPGDAPVILDTPCWGECEGCDLTNIAENINGWKKELIKICDFLGRETDYISGQPLLYFYDDGSVEKRVSYD